MIWARVARLAGAYAPVNAESIPMLRATLVESAEDSGMWLYPTHAGTLVQEGQLPTVSGGQQVNLVQRYAGPVQECLSAHAARHPDCPVKFNRILPFIGRLIPHAKLPSFLFQPSWAMKSRFHLGLGQNMQIPETGRP